MAMAERHSSDDFLDGFLAAARQAAPEPSADLLARVLADAEAQMAQRAAPPLPAAPVGAGIWAGIMSAVGGWRAMGGLATAAVTGVWIGFSGAEPLADAAGGLFAQGASDTLASISLLPEDDVLALAMDLEE